MALPSERSATNFLSLTSFSSSCLSRLTFDDPRPPYFSSFVKRSIRYLHVQHSPRFCRSYCVALTSWIQGRLLKLGRLIFVVPARRSKWELLANSIKDDRLVERKYAASSLIAKKARIYRAFYSRVTDLRRTLFSSDGFYSLSTSKSLSLEPHSTVTDLARLRGLSTSVPRATAV